MSGVGSPVKRTNNSALIPLPDMTTVSWWELAYGVANSRSMVDMIIAI